MTRTLFTTTAILSALLAGCSAAPVADGRLHIVAVERVQHGMARAEAMYRTGRYFQGQIRYEQAVAAYRAALAENPDHVEALNGLAVIAASRGQFADAERRFQQAIALAPAAAYLLNNLGYAYLREGRSVEAQVALARAVDLAPDNAHYRANFAQATEVLAQHKRMQHQARPNMAPQPTVSETARAPAPSVSVSAPVAAAGAAAPARPPRLEVANGNGVRGMAARTAGLLREIGLPASRLTNERPFRRWRTEIQYLAGHEAQARQVDMLLPVNTRLVEIPALQRGVELRVVIGHDLRDGALHKAAAAPPRRLAQPGGPAATPALIVAHVDQVPAR